MTWRALISKDHDINNKADHVCTLRGFAGALPCACSICPIQRLQVMVCSSVVWTPSAGLIHRAPNPLTHTVVDNVFYVTFAKRHAEHLDVGADKPISTPSTRVVDAHAGKTFLHIMIDCSPCLTWARARSCGHFVTALRRRTAVQESVGSRVAQPLTAALRNSDVN